MRPRRTVQELPPRMTQIPAESRRHLPQIICGHRRCDQRSSALKGQATLEYAVIVAVIIAALLAMQIYMKRGVQGKLRDATDQVGEQYRPADTVSQYTVHSQSTRNDTVDLDGTSTSTLTANEIQNKFGSETVDTSGETSLF